MSAFRPLLGNRNGLMNRSGNMATAERTPARGLLFRLFVALQNAGCKDVRPTDDWQGARFAWLGQTYEIRVTSGNG